MQDTILASFVYFRLNLKICLSCIYLCDFDSSYGNDWYDAFLNSFKEANVFFVLPLNLNENNLRTVSWSYSTISPDDFDDLQAKANIGIRAIAEYNGMRLY